MQKIYIVDDDASVRESLHFLMQSMGWQAEIFSGIDAFLQHTAEHHTLTGCLLLDVRMPGKSGLAWLEEGETPFPLLPVIVMTGHGTIETCRRAFRHGAFEFYTKPLDVDALIETINGALQESEQRESAWSAQQQLSQRYAQLSVREREVLSLLVEGQTSKEIGRLLDLSPRTVDAHRASIFQKVGVSNLAQVIRDYQRLHPAAS
ncbi:DNA-binding response regulator [Enterobacterales bacterium CwR94]|nr:DNA-binding response regulator [Enterobacterales bacterium CwR94]